MRYDPARDDPRYLGPDPAEVFFDEEKTRILKADAEKQLIECQEMHETFSTPGWQHVMTYLGLSIDALHTLLVSGGRDQRHEDQMRGKAQALKQLLNYPEVNGSRAKELSDFLNGSEQDTR